MSAGRRPAAPESVLRNVLFGELPHALSRPARPGTGIGAGANEAAARAPDLEAEAERVRPRTFEEGFAAGYQEGLEAARAEQDAALEAQLLAAAEKARAEAAQQGYADGLAQGRQAAEEALQEQQSVLAEETREALASNIAQLGALVDAVRENAQTLIEDAKDDLVALGHETVCRILGTRAATPESVLSMVDQLLAGRAQEDVKVHVHPDDFARLRPAQAGSAKPAWHWVADDQVRLGGVLLRSPQGSLDARLEVQLEALRRTLLQVRSGDLPAAGGVPSGSRLAPEREALEDSA